MQYIDKNNTTRSAGNQVTLDYLNDCCKDANGHYCNITYRNKRGTTFPEFCSCGTPLYYDRMVRLLMSEQDNRCCYCLRRLQEGVIGCDETVTIEHIVPQSFDDSNSSEFVKYADFAPSIKENVSLTKIFETQPGVQSMPPFPHRVAYDNMVVSCNGSFPPGVKSSVCCNIKRESKLALPVYFRNDVSQFVEYLNNGDIQANPASPYCTELREVISNAALDCPSLKEIRMVWFELSAHKLEDIKRCSTEADCEALLTNAFNASIGLTNPIRAAELVDKFKKHDYWHTLMLYDAFYPIMKGKYRTSKKNSASE